MDDVFVGSLMSTTVHTVTPDESVQQAAATMLARGIGSLVVVDDADRIAGILTATDFVQVAADGADAGQETVAAYMTEDVVTTATNETVTAAAEEIIDHGFHHLPVVDDDGGVVGIVSTTDLTAYVSGADEENRDRWAVET